MANYLLQSPHDLEDFMTFYTPEQVPVTAFLANNFAVCDQWYASVPSQTFTNRVFALCRSWNGQRLRHSFANDVDYGTSNSVLGGIANMASLLSALDNAFGTDGDPNWKIYFHDYCISVITLPYVYQKATATNPNVNVATFDGADWGDTIPNPATLPVIDLPKIGAVKIHGRPLSNKDQNLPSTFLQDVAEGTLPKFSFIEPRYRASLRQITIQRIRTILELRAP